MTNVLKPQVNYSWARSTLDSYSPSVNPLKYSFNPLNTPVPLRNPQGSYRYFLEFPQKNAIPYGSPITPTQKEGIAYYQTGIPSDLRNYYRGLEIPNSMPQTRNLRDVGLVYPNLQTGMVLARLNLPQ